MEKKISLTEALVQKIQEEENMKKITPTEQRILDAAKDIDVPEDIKLKIIDEFRKKSKNAYFAPYKVSIPKYIKDVAPDMVDYSLNSLEKNPQVIKAYYDRNYADKV